MNGDQLTKSRLRINNVLSSCIYVPSHLELFPQFRFVFLCGQISSIKRNEIRIFFFYKNYSRLFFILRMILKNEIENQKGKKEGKKEEMRDFDITTHH